MPIALYTSRTLHRHSKWKTAVTNYRFKHLKDKHHSGGPFILDLWSLFKPIFDMYGWQLACFGNLDWDFVNCLIAVLIIRYYFLLYVFFLLLKEMFLCLNRQPWQFSLEGCLNLFPDWSPDWCSYVSSEMSI